MKRRRDYQNGQASSSSNGDAGLHNGREGGVGAPTPQGEDVGNEGGEADAVAASDTQTDEEPSAKRRRRDTSGDEDDDADDEVIGRSTELPSMGLDPVAEPASAPAANADDDDDLEVPEGYI